MSVKKQLCLLLRPGAQGILPGPGFCFSFHKQSSSVDLYYSLDYPSERLSCKRLSVVRGFHLHPYSAGKVHNIAGWLKSNKLLPGIIREVIYPESLENVNLREIKNVRPIHRAITHEGPFGKGARQECSAPGRPAALPVDAGVFGRLRPGGRNFD